MKNRIKLLRKIKKLSQEELAERCNVSRQTINAIENDKYDPSLVLAFALSDILETSVDELFINKEDGE
ncbi:helix-turn-helix transcriptional regulator [Paenibacillus sp. SAF-054]|uniref:helix-turn-helix transcriptional regulator n=1 Tax=unclassified Paenibacillus TaxID=185978 RepID=UPI003F7F8429